VSITVTLAGDTMLGRGVAERIDSARPETLFAGELIETIGEADLFLLNLFLLNLECCIAERGSPWPGKTFHFRAPPVDEARGVLASGIESHRRQGRLTGTWRMCAEGATGWPSPTPGERLTARVRDGRRCSR
jgi:hypothetical protein